MALDFIAFAGAHSCIFAIRDIAATNDPRLAVDAPVCDCSIAVVGVFHFITLYVVCVIILSVKYAKLATWFTTECFYRS